ncbi:MAG: polysaccharide deacetylase family protein [Acidobacteria bacterium]|nr:polysaccharide deacetylase family protein [Acidobacteriota bacterium]
MQFLFRFGATAWARGRLERAGEAIVLTFHRVLTDDEFKSTHSPSGMVVHQQTFDQMFSALANDVEFVSLADLPRRTSRFAVAITFDDGWTDTHRACLDTLCVRSVPACVFVCSHLVGLSQPFWPERALAGLRRARAVRPVPQRLASLFAVYNMDLLRTHEDDLLQFLKQNLLDRSVILTALAESLPPSSQSVDTTMTWAELRQLLEHGIEIGSHTADHEILTELALPAQRAQLLDCNNRIQARLNRKPSFFSYPNGTWDEAARANVATCGYQCAFINAPGVWAEDTDPLLIPRINLSQSHLVGLDGRFSIASAHYHLFWLPYLHRRRSRNLPPSPLPLVGHLKSHPVQPVNHLS